MVPTRAPTRAASAAQTLWIHFEEALCSGHAWTWCGVVMMLLAVIGPAALVAAICTVGGVVNVVVIFCVGACRIGPKARLQELLEAVWDVIRLLSGVA